MLGGERKYDASRSDTVQLILYTNDDTSFTYIRTFLSLYHDRTCLIDRNEKYH
jgi:hypothetical protein